MTSPDLFGHMPPQADLFADEPAQPRQIMDFQAEARRRLLKMLAEVREASTLSWNERQLRKLEILFPQMAGWLPGDEADQLCFEFAREVERLRSAA